MANGISGVGGPSNVTAANSNASGNEVSQDDMLRFVMGKIVLGPIFSSCMKTGVAEVDAQLGNLAGDLIALPPGTISK